MSERDAFLAAMIMVAATAEAIAAGRVSDYRLWAALCFHPRIIVVLSR